MPDSPSRELTPTSPQGDEVTVEGLVITAPAGAIVSDTVDSNGNPATNVELPGAQGGLPRVRLRRIESFGRSLVEETYSQETVLTFEGEKNSYIRRTREKWPGADDAYVITWSVRSPQEGGGEELLDAVGFWLGDSAGGGWWLIATAKSGELEGFPVWDTVFSARITG